MRSLEPISPRKKQAAEGEEALWYNNVKVRDIFFTEEEKKGKQSASLADVEGYQEPKGFYCVNEEFKVFYIE